MKATKLLALGKEMPDASGSGSRQPVRSAHETYLAQVKSIRLDGVRVLLVEDSPDNQNLFNRILVGAGASVELASNGEEAVFLQRTANFDVIVMDIRMPVLDGYRATEQIRAEGFRGPILALTAHANPGEEDRCRAAGCSEFLLKPIDRLGLLRAVYAAAVANKTLGFEAL